MALIVKTFDFLWVKHHGCFFFRFHPIDRGRCKQIKRNCHYLESKFRNEDTRATLERHLVVRNGVFSWFFVHRYLPHRKREGVDVRQSRLQNVDRRLRSGRGQGLLRTVQLCRVDPLRKQKDGTVVSVVRGRYLGTFKMAQRKKKERERLMIRLR